MTSAPVMPTDTAPDQLRLSLKPDAPVTGHVDGAWWPRSRDLTAELPALLTALAGRVGPVERVSYNLTVWDPTVRRLDVGGSVVRLGGFRSQHTDTVNVLGARGRVTLLVVPPEATSERADRAMATAAQPGNSDGVAELLPLPAGSTKDGP